jgi:predicted metal-dependent peptidase
MTSKQAPEVLPPKQDLNNAILKLLDSEPFFAHFILGCRVVYDKFNVPTAGACFVKGVPTLVINSEFYSSLSKDGQTAILKHEVLHFVFNHLSRFKEGGTMNEDNHIMNLAMDCAINQHIKGLPDTAMTPERFEKELNKPEGSLERFQTTDYYYDFLQQNKEELKKKGQGMKTLDDHGIEGSDGDVEVDPNSQTGIKDITVKDLTRRAMNKSKGNISQDLIGVLGEMLKSSQVSWKQILRNFVSRSTTTQKEGTRKKRHRRYGLTFPGYKKKRLMKLGVCVDVSGSMSDEAISTCLNEVTAMLKSGQVAEIELIQADCEIKYTEKLTPSKPKYLLERKGSGGTAYGPAIEKCVELGCSAIVYMGDMDTADRPDDPGIPVLWITTRSEVRPGDFGEIIKIEESAT